MPEFDDVLTRHGRPPLEAGAVEVLQVNVGKLCNQTCGHCHVDAGPDRREVMSRETAALVIELLARNPAILTLDITGGAPELNPQFRFLVEQATALGRRVPGLDALAAAEVLLVFGPYLLEHYSSEALQKAVDRAPSVFLFSAHESSLDRSAGTVFPVAVPAEKSGTYVNVEGLRQSFVRSVGPQPGAVPELEILGCLADALGVNLGEPDAH